MAERINGGDGRTAIVRLAGVHKYFGGGASGVHALGDICLTVEAGEMVAICGASGSGKTTLLNLVGMLETPTDGNVIVDSLLVSKLSEHGRAALRTELIGYVFQEFSLIPVMTARENVLLPLLLRQRLDRAQLQAAHARADELLTLLGLGGQVGEYPTRLDASARQRVAIARALLPRPRLVLADEPLTRQDSGCQRMILDVWAREQREAGTAFLITTRDQRQLSRVTRTLQLSEGRLVRSAADGARMPVRVQL
ncbi:MAG: ABC transporter ATP-binding protein [Gammaproteobacteria bacterium]